MRRFYPLFLFLGIVLAILLGCNPLDVQGSPSEADDGIRATSASQSGPVPGLVEGGEAPLSEEAPTSTPDPSSPATANENAGDGEEEEDPVPVEVFEVRPEVLESEIETTGELRANEQVDLRSEASGRIVSLHFDEGQRVKAGELLVKVDDADLQAELRRMRAQKSLAQRREERSRALLEESTISQAIYDEAKSQLQVLGAQEDQLEARIRKTEVRAPFDGVVGLRAISEGSYVTPAQSIASLQNLDPIKVDFAVPEKYTGEIGPGDRLEFTVTGSTEVFVGKVYAVEPRIDPQTRTVQVRARAPNTSKRLLPGAFVRVRLVTDTESGALSVPAIALVPSAEGTHVFVVDADQQAEKRIVRTARRTEDRVQITDGLAPGERVIVSGVQQVKAGTRVEVRTVHR